MNYLTLTEDKVAVIPLEDSAITHGGLFLPDQGIQLIDQGIVKYIGPKVKSIRVGDHVVFSQYAGTQISLEDEGQLIIMHEPLVEAIINDHEAPVPVISFGRLYRILEEVYNHWLQANFGSPPDVVKGAENYKRDVLQYLQNLTWGEDFEF